MYKKPIFHNFDLYIRASQGDSNQLGVYFLSVQQSLAGETRRPVKVHIDLEEPSTQMALMALEYRDISKQALKDFGIQLTEWLIPPGSIRNLYQESIGRAEAKGHRLRLRLRIEPPELSVLPWEYMYDESTQDFFVLNPDTALVRYHNQPIPPIMMTKQAPISVLILIAEPEEVNALPYSHSELVNLLQALKRLLEQGVLVVDILYGGTSRQIIERVAEGQKGVRLLDENLSIDMFRSILRRNDYHVVHYIGHSHFDDEQGGALLLTDRDNKVALVGARRLEREMKGSNTSLVVLNACQSAEDGATRSYMGLAPSLIQAGIPAVVAMQYDIPDQAAMHFSRSLYQSLADGQPLDAAVVDGRIALTSLIQNDFLIDWGIPVLFMRSHNGMLWKQNTQNNDIHVGLQNFSKQALSSIHNIESVALVQGINRHLDYLKNESVQESKGGPYRGLLTYRLADADIFFGREEDIEQLLNHLDLSSLTILHAESGAGKSSLIQAGLAPRLIIQNRLPIYLSSYKSSPTLTLKRLLVTNLEEEPDLVAESLRDFLHRISYILGSQTRLSIILDQFEDFFILLEETIQTEFIHELADCLEDNTLDVDWVLSLRSEYFGNLANFRPRIANPFGNDHRLNRMSKNQAYIVIEEPANHYGIDFESGLIQLIIEDLNQASESTEHRNLESDEGVVPSHLQLVCRALYKALKPGQITISHALYNKFGGVAGILQNHLDRVLRRGFPADQKGTARFLLEALISSQTRRIMRTRTELIAELNSRNIDDVIIDRVLDQMVDESLIRVIDSYEEDEPVYELTHDYLIKEIELSDESKERKKAQELLEREVLNWRFSKIVISPQRLKIINEQRLILYFDEVAIELIARSAIEADQDIDFWLQMAPTELAHKILLDGLRDKESAVGVRAANYLTTYFDDNVEQWLVDVVNGSDLELHKAALKTLTQNHSSSARKIALDDLQHRDPDVRYHATKVLQDMLTTDASLKDIESTDVENNIAGIYSDPEIQLALFKSVTTDDEPSIWTQALTTLDIWYLKQSKEYWLPLLEAPLARQSAIYREVTTKKHLEIPPQLRFHLLWAHLWYLGCLQFRYHFLRSFILIFLVSILLFSGGNHLYNSRLDSKWSHYPGDMAERSLSTVAVTGDQILMIGSYDYGPALFNNNSWQDSMNGLHECGLAIYANDENANKCTIYAMSGSSQSQFNTTHQPEIYDLSQRLIKTNLPVKLYALVKEGIYHYENSESIWKLITLPKINGRNSQPGIPTCPLGTSIAICRPLAVYGNQLLLLTEDQQGVWFSKDGGDTWEKLKDRDNLLEQKFSVVAFDDNGTPYAGGPDGLYQGSHEDIYKWKYLWHDDQQSTTFSVKHMAIGTFHIRETLQKRLYLVIIDQETDSQQISCNEATGEFITASLQNPPVTNPLLNKLGARIGVVAIEPHPHDINTFYIADNFGAVYEMKCDGKRKRRIGQKPQGNVGPSSLAVWKNEQDRYYLLWANQSGLFRYGLNEEF